MHPLCSNEIPVTMDFNCDVRTGTVRLSGIDYSKYAGHQAIIKRISRDRRVEIPSIQGLINFELCQIRK